jgi:hypothetical protein
MQRHSRRWTDGRPGTLVPPALAMAYVKTRCVLHGFAVARVERSEPVETSELQARARADVGLPTPAAA